MTTTSKDRMCKNCGHGEFYHGQKLESNVNPWAYIDGECIHKSSGTHVGNRHLQLKDKNEFIKGYDKGTIILKNPRFGAVSSEDLARLVYSTAESGTQSGWRGIHLVPNIICGCMKFEAVEPVEAKASVTS